MGSEKPVSCVQSSINEMFPLFEWEAQNIIRQSKQFTKQNMGDNIEMSSSKRVYVTNSCVEDTITWRHIEIKIPLHCNF